MELVNEVRLLANGQIEVVRAYVIDDDGIERPVPPLQSDISPVRLPAQRLHPSTEHATGTDRSGS